MAHVIVIDRLVKRYGAVTALANISLSVKRGEFIALLGPSGCGKTTLLRTIAGFVEPTSGTIDIDGKPMDGVPQHQRPVNTVFQQYALFPHMTVADNVAFGPRRKRVGKAELGRRVREALTMVGLGAFGGRFPRELSGGEQQRVALARAIINQPDVLLLDEPLGALDLKLRKRMQVELKRLHQQLGMTFLFVTHDQEEALAMADRIAVMREGEIVQLGSGSEIYRNPVSRYVADFIGEANLVAARPGADGSLKLADDGPSLPYRWAAEREAKVALMIRPEDIQIGGSRADTDDVIITARLRDKAFVGSSWRLYFIMPGGQEIAVHAANSPDVEQIEPGNNICLRWRRDAARVLTD
jgi:spermidine/putrescine transport system ATP-binding protein